MSDCRNCKHEGNRCVRQMGGECLMFGCFYRCTCEDADE